MITDEMIEAAAKAIYKDRNGEGCTRWQHQNSLVKSAYRSDARAALEAVAPMIRAAAMEEAAKIAGADAGMTTHGNMDFGPNVATRIAVAIRAAGGEK